jgi:hypothetical protein
MRRGANDPQDLSDTHHLSFDITDATNAPAAAGAAELVAGEERWVEILRGDADRVVLAGSPDESSLYRDLETCGTGLQVDQQQGTVAQPMAEQSLVEDALYIGGSPSAADVQQGYVGDCYFLAVVCQIAGSDPAKIKDVLTVSGNSISATFQSWDSASGAWQDTVVSSDSELAFYHDDAGVVNIGALNGAGVFVTETPVTAEWWAAHDGSSNTLEVHTVDMFEAALWVAYLEKLYAIYAETHGQYGGAPGAQSSNATTDANGNQVSGYEVIDGGFEEDVYGVFYGPDVLTNNSNDMNYDASSMSNTILSNLPALSQLLLLMGEGANADESTMLTAWSTGSEITTRLRDTIDLVLADTDTDQYPSWKTNLQYSRTVADNYLNASSANEDARMATLVSAATNMSAPGAWPVMWDDNSPKMYHDCLELFSDVMHLGSDASNGRRNTYSGHAYSVTAAYFQDATGAKLDLTQSNLATEAANLSAELSTVVMRNPHHTNEPDMDGNGPADGKDDGEFTMTLESFFRNMSGLDDATVSTH